MAGKAKIKIIKDDAGGGDGATMATSGTAASTAPTAMITVVDTKSGEELTFEQPNYKALLFNVDDVIKYETLTVPGAKPVIINARRFQAGTVSSVTDNSNGILTEKITGKKILFFQTNLKEQGIVAGTEVKYDLVPSAKVGEIAVNLEANV